MGYHFLFDRILLEKGFGLRDERERIKQIYAVLV
jgi:hypothetical protein